jgi:ubiquinone/menaquinone biosynthesis C-methylase UbiE
MDTGQLFGLLWHQLTDTQFRESVALFNRRFEANGFDLGWFKGKQCLDAGTGSGRNALAMANLGADVSACDISEAGLATAIERTQPARIEYRRASVLDLPYPNATFDFVYCAGVLHHTPSVAQGMDELTRVLKRGGKLFLLLYGVGGLRWKLVAALRQIAQELGYDAIDRAITAAGLPANNRKNFLDDLFVPIQTHIRWTDLEQMLADRGYGQIDRWTLAKLDQEASPEAQLEELTKLERIFSSIGGPLGGLGHRIAADFCGVASQNITDHALVIGEGNHRVLAAKA